jgi:hypothetical protein
MMNLLHNLEGCFSRVLMVNVIGLVWKVLSSISLVNGLNMYVNVRPAYVPVYVHVRVPATMNLQALRKFWTQFLKVSKPNFYFI